MRRELLLIGEMVEAAEQASRSSEAQMWLTVLGEAAAQLDDQVKRRFPTIEWARPAQLRNRVIHGYWSIDLEILHTTATDQRPGFVEQLRAALAAIEADDA